MTQPENITPQVSPSPPVDYEEIKQKVEEETELPAQTLDRHEHELAQHKAVLDEYKTELKHVNAILVAGVVVLLVMVATLMAMLLINYINSYDNYSNAAYLQLSNQNYSLEKRIEILENTKFPTPTIPLKINITPTPTP